MSASYAWWSANWFICTIYRDVCKKTHDNSPDHVDDGGTHTPSWFSLSRKSIEHETPIWSLFFVWMRMTQFQCKCDMVYMSLSNHVEYEIYCIYLIQKRIHFISMSFSFRSKVMHNFNKFNDGSGAPPNKQEKKNNFAVQLKEREEKTKQIIWHINDGKYEKIHSHARARTPNRQYVKWTCHIATRKSVLRHFVGLKRASTSEWQRIK